MLRYRRARAHWVADTGSAPCAESFVPLPEIAMSIRPDRTLLAPGLEISRVVTGLWQVADMERDSHLLDRDAAAAAMAAYAREGFDSFDMADHYGSAELITGRFLGMQVGAEG